MQSKQKKQTSEHSTLTKLKQHSNHRISIIIITVITLRQQSGEGGIFYHCSRACIYHITQ